MSTASPAGQQIAKSKRLQVSRRIFSFPVMLACFLAVLAVLTVRGRFEDPDMWWHLKTGQVIWTTRSIPTTDLFSFTARHASWIPHEWLAQVTIYCAYQLDGYSGMMLWLCLFTAALLVGGYVLCSSYSGNAKIAFLGAMVLWFFSTAGLSVRPQVIGYALFVIELLLVHLGRTRSPRWFWGLPPLFALWVNCHGSFFLGLIVLGILLICSFIDLQKGLLVSLSWEPARRRMFAVVLASSAVAVFLNPDGVKQVWYPVNTMFRQPVNLSQIAEWKPLVVSDARGVALMVVLALVFFLLILRRSQVLFLDELLLLALGAWLALSHERLAFVFGILAAPILSRLLSTMWDGYDAERDLPVANAVLIAISAVAMFLPFPSGRVLSQQVEKDNPVQAVAYIKAHHLTGNMLNAYGYGGYLIWAMPEHPVFIDGRADLYEWAGILSQFGRWALVQEDPNRLLDKYHVGFCLIERDSPMAYVLPLMHNWKQVYSDKLSVVFVRVAAGPAAN